jgi:hypothetical protein
MKSGVNGIRNKGLVGIFACAAGKKSCQTRQPNTIFGIFMGDEGQNLVFIIVHSLA